MQSPPERSQILLRNAESAVARALASRNVRVTPQAVAAAAHAVITQSESWASFSGATLAGLFAAGSYTVDVLETSGADVRQLDAMLQDLVMPADTGETIQQSVERYVSEDLVDKGILASVKSANRVLETADVFEAAIYPMPEQEGICSVEECERACGADWKSSFFSRAAFAALGTGVKVLCDFQYPKMGPADFGPVRRVLLERRAGLSLLEENLLNHRLSVYTSLEAEDLDFLTMMMNAWFQRRRLVTSPSHSLSQLITRLELLMFDVGLIGDAGADYGRAQQSLALARRFVPERDEPFIALTMDARKRIHLAQFTYRNTLATQTHGKLMSGPTGVTISAVRPLSLLSHENMEGLSRLLSDADVEESELQTYLDANPEVLLALGYTRAIPHVVLADEVLGRKLIPDYVLQVPGRVSVDILDLKRPTESPIVSGRYPRPSAELLKAVAQLRAYGDYFERSEHRKQFEQRYGLEAFRPLLTVVMGRDVHFESIRQRREIEAQTSGVRLVTYDELMAYGRTRLVGS